MVAKSSDPAFGDPRAGVPFCHRQGTPTRRTRDADPSVAAAALHLSLDPPFRYSQVAFATSASTATGWPLADHDRRRAPPAICESRPAGSRQERSIVGEVGSAGRVGTPAQTLPTIRPVVTTNLKFPPLGGRLSSAKLPLGQPASSSTANPKRGSISDLHHSAGRCRVRADAVSRNASLRSRGRGFGRARSTVASRSCAGRAGRVSSGSLETVARERSARGPVGRTRTTAE